ncbi:mucin-associated surface protein (MASP), putative, partial [Trypanosoma cruzi]
LRWRAQLQRECAEEVGRRTGGRANASAVEECVRRGMDGVRAVVDGRRRWRPQRYALVAKDPEDGPTEAISVGSTLPPLVQETQGTLQGSALRDQEKSLKGGAGGGTELGLEQPQPEESSVTKNKELDVRRELMDDENKSVPERKVLVGSDLKDSKAMKVPANQPEVDALLPSSSDVRAADVPGGVSSDLSSEVSRSSEASGKGGGDQQKNTSVAAKTSAAAPSPKESFHTASSPAKEDTESTQPADVLLKQGNITTTDATQNVTTEGQEETKLSSFAADDDNAVANDADEDNTGNSGDDLASRAAVTDEKQQHQREDGSEKETAPEATPQVKNEDPGSADVVSVQQVQKAQGGRESGSESRKEDSVLTTSKQQDGTSDSHAESTPTSRLSEKSVAASNGPDEATVEEISNKNTAGVDAGPEAAQDDGNKDDSTKETPIKITDIANDTTPTGDSDSSTAVSHTTSPLLLLLVIACAAAVVAA